MERNNSRNRTIMSSIPSSKWSHSQLAVTHNVTQRFSPHFEEHCVTNLWDYGQSTGGPHKRRAWLFVWNIKKCMEEYWRVLYRKLISRNGQVKAQDKCKPTSIVVCCRFCGSTWRIWAILWVFRWLLLYVIRRRQGWKAHFRPLQRQADFHPEIRIARLPNRTPDKLKGWRFF